MNLQEFASRVDYNLLQEQKALLLKLLSNPMLSNAEVDLIDGLVIFLDNYQDSVVETGIMTEDQAFPTLK